MAAGVVALMFVFNRLGVTHTAPYALLRILLWVCVLKSGVHATLAGLAMALAIPMRSAHGESPAKHLEHALHPWVAFLVVPVFGFANAGISFYGGIVAQTVVLVIFVVLGPLAVRRFHLVGVPA